MRIRIFTLLLSCLLGFLGKAEVRLYDPIQKSELVFTATSRVEHLEIDELNKQGDVDYIFFVFEDEILEKKRQEKFHETLKRWPLKPFFKKGLSEFAKQEHKDFWTDQYEGESYYELPKFRGYTIVGIDLEPMSYLGNTLTFSYTIEFFLPGTDSYFDFKTIHLLNLDDFTTGHIESINDQINQEALRIALKKKWKSITDYMPNRNWALQNQIPVKSDNPYQQYNEQEQELQSYYSDSLVSYAIEKADLNDVEAYWTGAGVMVRLKGALDWFQKPIPLVVKLHLLPWEAEEAFKNCASMTLLENVKMEKTEKWNVDPKDMLRPASFLNLERLFVNLLEVEDHSIKSIESVYRDNPQDSQYIHRIEYQKGKAQLIKRDNNRYKEYYDSIFWDDNQVFASIVNEKINYGMSKGFYRNLRLQKRNKNGNTVWYLTTGEGIYIDEYVYFEDRVARVPYNACMSGLESASFRHRPQWLKLSKNGLCFKGGDCIRLNKKGQLIQWGKNSYAYKDGQLLQILGEREKYTLFYYDDLGRITKVKDELTGQKLLNYFYEGDSELPYRIEKFDDRSRNTYYYIHRD